MQCGSGEPAGDDIPADVVDERCQTLDTAVRAGQPEGVRSGLSEEAALDPASKLGVGQATGVCLRPRERAQLTFCNRHQPVVRSGHGTQYSEGVPQSSDRQTPRRPPIYGRHSGPNLWNGSPKGGLRRLLPFCGRHDAATRPDGSLKRCLAWWLPQTLLGRVAELDAAWLARCWLLRTGPGPESSGGVRPVRRQEYWRRSSRRAPGPTRSW